MSVREIAAKSLISSGSLVSALGTENPFRSDFEGVFAFFGKLLANISENKFPVIRRDQMFVIQFFTKS